MEKGKSKRGEQVDIVEKTKLGGELQMFLLLIQARRDVWGMAAFGCCSRETCKVKWSEVERGKRKPELDGIYVNTSHAYSVLVAFSTLDQCF